MLRIALQDGAALGQGQRLGVPEQRRPDPPACEVREDMNVEECEPRVLLQPGLDERRGDHTAVLTHDEMLLPGVGGVTEVLQPGPGRERPVQVAPGLKLERVAELSVFMKVRGVRGVEACRDGKGFNPVRHC